MESVRIRLKDLYKSYNGKAVVKGCTHDFEQGRLHALIGPNGSGKSTLLRLCCHIEAPDSGQVLLGDSLLSGSTLELRRKIALVFSKGGLFNTSVFKNVLYGLKIRGVSMRKRRALAEEILSRVGLLEKRKQNARTLSAGEGQRLAIARALVTEPEIILLDEPTASLDPANTIIIEELIRTLIKDGKKTVIMATHNMFQAQRLSDKVVFMHEGSIFDEGLTGSFFRSPKNEIAHKFITGTLVY